MTLKELREQINGLPDDTILEIWHDYKTYNTKRADNFIQQTAYNKITLLPADIINPLVHRP